MTRSCTTCSHPRAVSDPSAGAVREFELALACAAISPGLRTVLVLNADERTLQFAADILARYVRDLTGRTTVTVAVPSASDEDGAPGIAHSRRRAKRGSCSRSGQEHLESEATALAFQCS